jgi:hypothetical protein
MGIDAAALAGVCDTVAATGYAADPGRLNLAAKVALARERGLGRLDFYHYGFCRLQALDWIRQALAA